jgi:hypothetical protein
MESTKVAANAALNPHTAAKNRLTLLDKAQKLIRMGIAIVPTYPGCRAPLFEDWQNLATTDVCKFEEWMNLGYPLPDGLHAVTEDHNIICVARKDGVQCFDVDDYEACLDLGMPPLPNSVFQVDTPSGGLHVPVNSTPATADLGNLNVHENKFNTNTKKILEFKAHNSAWCAPSQTRDDGGRYKPRDSRARILGQEQTEYISELVQWIKDHSVQKRAYERRTGSVDAKFHPSFSSEEFLDRQGLEEHDSGTVDGAFHLVPDSCPLCGKEARDTTLAGAVTKFIFGGHGYGFICHACAVTTRAEYEQEMLKLNPEYTPWGAYQDEWIYADDDPVLLTEAFNIDEEISSVTPRPIEIASKSKQAQDLEAFVNVPFAGDEIYATSSEICSTDIAPVHTFTYELSDTGNGERLVRLFGSKIRYIYESGQWMVSGPRGWVLDNKGELMRMTKFVTTELIEESRSSAARSIRKDGSIDKGLFKQSTAIATHAQRSASLAGRKAMIASASNEKGILTNMEEWDADRWLLNVQNGVIHLRTQKFRERRPEDLCSKQAAALYDPKCRLEAMGGSAIEVYERRSGNGGFPGALRRLFADWRLRCAKLDFQYGRGEQWQGRFHQYHCPHDGVVCRGCFI